jgi:hypothetical protein
MDINIQTDGLREFAYQGEGMLRHDNVKPNLTTASCSDFNLPAAAAFKQVDERAITRIMELMTDVEQTFNGICAGALGLADIYDNADLQVADVLGKIAHEQNLGVVAPREPNLEPVDPDLQAAQQAGTPPPPEQPAPQPGPTPR